MLRLVHIVGFTLATGGCFVALIRARRIIHRETRRGLLGLFALSGVWAGSQIVILFDVSVTVGTVAYQVGLLAGLATVGSWLYFCSAYAGHDYHRDPLHRRVAVGAFLGISALKLTNGIHGRYFEAMRVTDPFPHVGIELLGLHWAVSLFAYALTAVGFYMLFELFAESEVETTGLSVLMCVTAVPVVLNVLRDLIVPGLAALSYEPVGVAVFAVGALYLTEDTFEQIRWTDHRKVLDQIDEAVFVLDESKTIQDFNSAADSLFPDISCGSSVESVLPGFVATDRLRTAGGTVQRGNIVTVERSTGDRYCLASETPMAIGPGSAGSVLVVTDVTQVEQQRRELRRQSEQLDGFAAAIAHELRNALSAVEANLQLLTDPIDPNEHEDAETLVDRISTATERMNDVVYDLITLARLSQRVTSTERIEVENALDCARAPEERRAFPVTVERNGVIEGEHERVEELLTNVVELADATDAAALRISTTAEGIVFALEGASVPADSAQALFTYGTAVPNAEAGMLGPNIQTLARAHGWEVSVTNDESGAVELRVTGITVVRRDA